MESALHGASLEAVVGHVATDTPKAAAAARAVSRALPPPAPTITPARPRHAADFTLSISATQHSPPNASTSYAYPAAESVVAQASASCAIAVLPATINAGPDKPRAAIS